MIGISHEVFVEGSLAGEGEEPGRGGIGGSSFELYQVLQQKAVVPKLFVLVERNSDGSRTYFLRKKNTLEFKAKIKDLGITLFEKREKEIEKFKVEERLFVKVLALTNENIDGQLISDYG